MTTGKPQIEINDEEFIYQKFAEDAQQTNYNMGDCCEIGKFEWNEVVQRMEQKVNNTRSDEIIQILNPSHLDCRNFVLMLIALRKLRPGSDAISATNMIVGRYFRIDKIKTSLLSSIASIAKQAGAEALVAMVECHSKKADYQERNWMNTLRRDNI